MRSALAILILVTSSGAEPSPEAVVLARLLDSGTEAVRADVRLALAGAEGAVVLDRVAPLVTTDRGRELVAAILGDLRAAVRKDAALAERITERVSAETRWRLGLGRAGVLYFDARTFARVEMGIERLSTLEYLACPDDPKEPGKRYECLAGLDAAEWEAFRAACEPDRALVLRWRKADGAITEVALADALPWAKAGAPGSEGLKIGGNHDERENPRLPPHETPIQIGIARRARSR
jgi:hypothetical protein